MLLALVGSPQVLVAESALPNVLFVFVDDLGYGDLGSFGHPVIQTPNIDQLAAEGLSLQNYYASSALCSPSRAALLTGRLPYRSGIKSWIPEDSGIFLRPEEVTIAELLLAQGYQTAIIGKWHLNSDLSDLKEPQPRDHGFEYAFGHNAFQIPTNKNPVNVFRNGKHVPNLQGYTADIYADDAIRWLENRDPSKPFFLLFSMAEPHTTIENPPEFNRRYSQFTQGEIEAIPSGGKKPPKEKLKARGPGEYYANITYMDHQIGRVLASLDELGLVKNTLVVFTSDNGPVTSDWINWWEVNAYGSTGGYRGRKHTLYEGGIKVPAIIRYPGVVEPGSKSQQLIIGTDWFVTLASLAKAEIPKDRAIDGVDISPVFAGDLLTERTVFWSLDAHTDVEHAVRAGSWKLLVDRGGNPRELFNLATDPLEFFNLIETEPKITEQLKDAFDGYRSTLPESSQQSTFR